MLWTNGTIVFKTSSPTWMITSRPSSTRVRSDSVTRTAISISASRARSRPVISQSIHTSRSFTWRGYTPTLRWTFRASSDTEVFMAAQVLSEQDVQAGLASLHADWTGGTDQVSRSIEF